ERHQHSAIAGLFRIAHAFVVRADEHHAASDDWIAVALRTEVGHPFHVLLRLDVPVGRQTLHRGHHVAIGSAAPHRPVAAAGIGNRHRRAPRGRGQEEYESEGYVFHWLAESFRLSRYAPNSASTKNPGAPLRLPAGSSLSICHSAGSGWPVSHALPRARTLPSAVFSTRSLRWYQVSAFHWNGTTAERSVSGSHGSSLSCCRLP